MKNYLKYLFVSFLLFSDVVNAQDDTTQSTSIILVYYDQPEWYFTDTLVSQLSRVGAHKKWTKITFLDQVYPKYLNTISFVQNKKRVDIVDSSGIKMKTVSKKKVDELLLNLVHEIKKSDSIYVKRPGVRDPLSQYNLDSVWYKDKILSVWEKYRKAHSIHLDSSQLTCSQTALLDYQSMYRTLQFPNNWNPNEGIVVDVKIEYPSDTLHIQATSYFAYSLPWYYFNNQTRLSNSGISISIGRLLRIANRKSGNLDRLMGTNFEMLLMDDIYNRYLKKKINVH
jgi:hypothetical protein